MNNNQLSGSLEMLKGCTALKFFDGSHNQLVGDLEPLQGCTVNAFL